MNNHYIDLETTAEIVKKILPKMGEYKVPITPQNYRVWFEYYSGTNKELTEEIDSIIKSNRKFTHDLNRYLYTKYFGDDHNKEVLREVQSKTINVLKNFLEQVLGTTSTTSDYGNKLEKYSELLNKAEDLTEIQQILEDMIKETSNMVKSTRDLQSKLQEASSQVEMLREELAKTAEEAKRDALTGLSNRKAFDEEIDKLYARYKEKGEVFSLIIIDIDHFKNFNDKFGHKVGDKVLQIAANTLNYTLKGKDFVGRYGGEEFVVLLPLTSLDNACVVAEQIRENIARKRLRVTKTGENLGTITVSAGVAQIRENDTVESLIERADRALYLAKNSGRNNVKSEMDLVKL